MELYIILLLVFSTTKISCIFIYKHTLAENSIHNSPILDLEEILIQKNILKHSNAEKYKIYSFSNSKTIFSLVKHKLYATSKIDRELICSKEYQLETERKLRKTSCTNDDCCIVFGFQIDKGNQVDSYYLLIQITDQNDNFPKFQPANNPYRIVVENTPINAVIDLPVATDADSKQYGVQKYIVEKPFLIGNHSHFVLKEPLDKSGKPQLIVAMSLDREKMSTYRFRFRALDRGQEEYKYNNYDTSRSSVEIELKIGDVNDNTPKFDKLLYESNVEEHSSMQNIISFKVSDNDEGLNQEVSVSLSTSDNDNYIAKKINRLFHIEFSSSLKSGYIKLIDDLDYENIQRTLEFHIIAKDHGKPSLSSTARVVVNVINVNDHAPDIRVIKNGQIVSRSISITENKPIGKLVAIIQVTDRDSPLSEIECLLIDESLSFQLIPKGNFHQQYAQLNKEFDLRTVRSLDREADSGTLFISIKCNDRNKQKPLVKTYAIRINIEDVNDNAPVFDRQTYRGDILENQAHSIVKLTEPLKTTDRDYGINSQVSYSLRENGNSSDWSLFSIDKDSGQIYVQQHSLDFESQKTYLLVVVATDKLEPSLSSSTTVQVHVQDANDNQPVFRQKHYSFSVRENAPVNTEIGRVEADDADSIPKNKLIRYSEKLADRISNWVTIDENTGVLRTVAAVDRERQQSISLIVTARNQVPYQRGDLTDPDCIILVSIDNVNDNAPRFQQVDPTSAASLTFYVSATRPNSPQKQQQPPKQSNKHSPGDPMPLPVLINENCHQIPYDIIDPDFQSASQHEMCCLLNLDNDHRGLFYFSQSLPNLLCVQESLLLADRPTLGRHGASYRLTVVATDRPDAQNNTLQSRVTFNVLLRSESMDGGYVNNGGLQQPGAGGGGGRGIFSPSLSGDGDDNAGRGRGHDGYGGVLGNGDGSQIDGAGQGGSSGFSLVIVIIIVVLVCVLIVVLAVMVLYRYAAMTSGGGHLGVSGNDLDPECAGVNHHLNQEEAMKRNADRFRPMSQLQTVENNLTMISKHPIYCTKTLWTEEDIRLMQSAAEFESNLTGTTAVTTNPTSEDSPGRHQRYQSLATAVSPAGTACLYMTGSDGTSKPVVSGDSYQGNRDGYESLCLVSAKNRTRSVDNPSTQPARTGTPNCSTPTSMSPSINKLTMTSSAKCQNTFGSKVSTFSPSSVSTSSDKAPFTFSQTSFV